MQDSISLNSEVNVRLEVAILVPPWPQWLRPKSDQLDCEVALVDVAERILSSDINEGMYADTASRLVSAIAGPRSVLGIWVYANRQYRESVLGELGLSRVSAFWPFVEHRAAAGYYEIEQNLDGHPTASSDVLLSEQPGMIEVICSSLELMRLGLPYTFLSVWGWNDRLGVSSGDDLHEGFPCFPTYRDMLSRFDIVQMPGGIHGSDCFFTSRSVSAAELITRIVQAGTSVGLDIDYIGAIQQDRYELLKERSDSSRPGEFK